MGKDVEAVGCGVILAPPVGTEKITTDLGITDLGLRSETKTS
jgi:hypothetical protein